ncbi:MAG: electron-transfer flavoprotein:ubiquinone oxidoreductase, partial [Planctomycetota bacterium]
MTVFAEGVRGNLAKNLFRDLDVMDGRNPQTFGTGIKEIWEVSPEVGKEMFGKVMHTGGYPLDTKGYGGGWIYGLPDNRLSIGYVVGLDHPDARLDPHALFVKWKQHPFMQELLKDGKVVRYGAKAVPEGGYFAMPKLSGDGFVLVGDTAGFLNAATLKGIHLAIKSGMLAAEAIADALIDGDTSDAKLSRYQDLFEGSWARDELYRQRNYRQAFEGGLFAGMFDVGLQMVTGGRGLKARRAGHQDHAATQRIQHSKFEKPKYDDGLSLDKLTDVYHSGAIHDEDQPAHLRIMDPDICVSRCTEEYGNPCQHFCPAAVYEWPEEAEPKGVTINFSNCVHCKTCDVADPYQ